MDKCLTFGVTEWVKGRAIKEVYKKYALIRLYPSCGWFEEDLCEECEYYVIGVDLYSRKIIVVGRVYCGKH